MSDTSETTKAAIVGFLTRQRGNWIHYCDLIHCLGRADWHWHQSTRDAKHEYNLALRSLRDGGEIVQHDRGHHTGAMPYFAIAGTPVPTPTPASAPEAPAAPQEAEDPGQPARLAQRFARIRQGRAAGELPGIDRMERAVADQFRRRESV